MLKLSLMETVVRLVSEEIKSLQASWAKATGAAELSFSFIYRLYFCENGARTRPCKPLKMLHSRAPSPLQSFLSFSLKQNKMAACLTNTSVCECVFLQFIKTCGDCNNPEGKSILLGKQTNSVSEIVCCHLVPPVSSANVCLGLFHRCLDSKRIRKTIRILNRIASSSATAWQRLRSEVSGCISLQMLPFFVI